MSPFKKPATWLAVAMFSGVSVGAMPLVASAAPLDEDTYPIPGDTPIIHFMDGEFRTSSTRVTKDTDAYPLTNGETIINWDPTKGGDAPNDGRFSGLPKDGVAYSLAWNVDASMGDVTIPVTFRNPANFDNTSMYSVCSNDPQGRWTSTPAVAGKCTITFKAGKTYAGDWNVIHFPTEAGTYKPAMEFGGTVYNLPAYSVIGAPQMAAYINPISFKWVTASDGAIHGEWVLEVRSKDYGNNSDYANGNYTLDESRLPAGSTVTKNAQRFTVKIPYESLSQAGSTDINIVSIDHRTDSLHSSLENFGGMDLKIPGLGESVTRTTPLESNVTGLTNDFTKPANATYGILKWDKATYTKPAPVVTWSSNAYVVKKDGVANPAPARVIYEKGETFTFRMKHDASGFLNGEAYNAEAISRGGTLPINFNGSPTTGVKEFSNAYFVSNGVKTAVTVSSSGNNSPVIAGVPEMIKTGDYIEYDFTVKDLSNLMENSTDSVSVLAFNDINPSAGTNFGAVDVVNPSFVVSSNFVRPFTSVMGGNLVDSGVSNNINATYATRNFSSEHITAPPAEFKDVLLKLDSCYENPQITYTSTGATAELISSPNRGADGIACTSDDSGEWVFSVDGRNSEYIKFSAALPAWAKPNYLLKHTWGGGNVTVTPTMTKDVVFREPTRTVPEKSYNITVAASNVVGQTLGVEKDTELVGEELSWTGLGFNGTTRGGTATFAYKIDPKDAVLSNFRMTPMGDANANNTVLEVSNDGETWTPHVEGGAVPAYARMKVTDFPSGFVGALRMTVDTKGSPVGSSAGVEAILGETDVTPAPIPRYHQLVSRLIMPANPMLPKLEENTGLTEDVLTPPSTEGVDYTVTHDKATGAWSITAKPQAGYAINAQEATAAGYTANGDGTWMLRGSFQDTPVVSPQAPIVTDNDGYVKDSVMAPQTEGVDYALDYNQETGVWTLTARPQSGYSLREMEGWTNNGDGSFTLSGRLDVSETPVVTPEPTPEPTTPVVTPTPEPTPEPTDPGITPPVTEPSTPTDNGTTPPTNNGDNGSTVTTPPTGSDTQEPTTPPTADGGTSIPEPNAPQPTDNGTQEPQQPVSTTPPTDDGGRVSENPPQVEPEKPDTIQTGEVTAKSAVANALLGGVGFLGGLAMAALGVRRRRG